MKLILCTKKYKVNLNVLFKNIFELMILLISSLFILKDVYSLVFKPIFTGVLTSYTSYGLLTLMILVFLLIITYDDLKQYTEFKK